MTVGDFGMSSEEALSTRMKHASSNQVITLSGVT
jgi:hypothetical protein